MRLNPIKCKEMLINFMLYPNFNLRPIICKQQRYTTCIDLQDSGSIYR